MWTIKELKSRSRVNIKKNYWAMVAVCFIMAFLVSEYAVSDVLFSETRDSLTPEKYTKDVQKIENVAENIKDEGVYTVESDEKFLFSGVAPATIINHYVERILNIDESIGENINATQGVMATFVNGWLRGVNVLKYAVVAIDSAIMGHKHLQWILALILLLVNAAFIVFVKNLLLVGERRFFLENHRYHDTQVKRIFFLYGNKKIVNPAKIMMLRNIYIFLWAFTIVGGIYKFYQYKMIKYILAENPDIGVKECFSLSKDMTRGCKMKMFKVDLSFVPWYILSIIGFGIPAWFYVNPYYTATEAEVYFMLRDRAYVEGIDGFELLNDDLLVHEPEEREVDIYPTLEIKARRGEFTKWKKSYSPVNFIMMFFTFMFIGWVWEVIYTFMLHGDLCNRGSLHGPWLPIYGFGGIMIIILFRKFGEKPHKVFILSFVSCGVMEYCTGWFFDNIKGLKYWDYSNYFMNLNGYICLEGLLMFAILACAGFYLIAPKLDDLFNKVPYSIRFILIVVLLPLFVFDVIYSHFIPNVGEGIGGEDYKQ